MPVATPTHLTWSELGLTLTVAIVAAVVGGYVAYRLFYRYSRKVRIRVPRRPEGTLARKFGHLYTELIAEADRLAPSGVTKWIGQRGHCPRTGVAIRLAANRSRHTLHFLLVASCAGAVIGFLKAIYLPRCGLLFVAYLGADKRAEVPSRQVILPLLARLERIVRWLGPNCKWIAYEVTGASTDRRIRLFSDYAEMHGFRSYCLPIEYLQPDMDPTVVGKPNGAPATLAVIPVPDDKRAPIRITASETSEIVEAIYHDVYAEIVDGSDVSHDVYAAYIEALLRRVASSYAGHMPLQTMTKAGSVDNERP